MKNCPISNVIPIPTHIGLINHILMGPCLIFEPKHMCSHINGIPKIKERIKNCTIKFAVMKIIFVFKNKNL